MLLLSDTGKLYTFTHSFNPGITMSTYYVKSTLDSKMTNFNFLGSPEILTALRACLWKQASQHLEYRSGKFSNRGSGVHR